MSMALAAMSLVVVTAGPTEGGPSQGVPDGLEGWDEPVDVESPSWVESSSAPLEEMEGAAPLPEAVFPAASSWEVPVDAESEASSERAAPEGAAEDRPVRLTVEPAGSASGPAAAEGAAGSGAVQVDVLERDVAHRLGVSGFVFSVAGASGASLADVTGGGELRGELAIDYSGFAPAYGGDYAHRLQVVALPACALQDPLPEGCVVRRHRLESANDVEAGRLTVEVPDLAAVSDGLEEVSDDLAGLAERVSADDGGAVSDFQAEVDQPEAEGADVPDELAPFESSDDHSEAALADPQDGGEAPAGGDSPASEAVVLAVTAGGSSDVGTYEATPVSPAGEWSVSPGSGEFTYSYPVDVPAPAGGQAPEVGLSYSSGAVDGLTLATNAQAPQTGVGWSDFASSFISRGYQPCIEAEVFETSDLCWEDHNASISLGGVSGPLVPLDDDYRQWRVQGDPGWRVERVGTPDGTAVAGEHSKEYWVVTGPDGTQYWFGLNFDPDTSRRTNSWWYVPIVGDHAGEPCYQPDGQCNVAWRWNLDRVVDPNGNLTTYFYRREGHRYDSLLGLEPRTFYIRSGTLDRVEYGGRDGTTLPPAGQMTFGVQNRCVFLEEACPAVASGSTSYYEDVPVDLVCDTQQHCPSTAPVFFSGRRYSHVRTEVRVGDDWKAVTQHNLLHRFITHNTSTDAKLYLGGVQHAGVAGGLDIYPNTHFGYADGRLSNRIGGPTNTRMQHYRIAKVTNPFGAQIDVVYGRNRVCDADYQPPGGRWDQNVRDCFPQRVRGSDGQTRHGLFNKYLVMSVTETPGFSSSAATMTTTYDYGGDPAWAYDFSAFARDDAMWGWVNWRGYGTATVTQGSSTTRLRLFRGMHGDPVRAVRNGEPCACGQRDEQVHGMLDDTHAVDDLPVLAGRTLEEQKLDGDGDVAQSTVYGYEVRETATPLPEWQEFSTPMWAGVSSTTENVALADGSGYRQRGGSTTYSTGPAPQPVRTEESGWLDEDGDERCSITEYAEPAVPDETGTWMWVYPRANREVEGPCDADPLGAVVSESETAYDGQAVGAPPTVGNVTLQRSRIDDTRWAETRTTVDELGRPTVVERENGDVDARTETAYTAAAVNQIPTETTETAENGDHDLVTTTTYEPDKGAPVRIEDPNGNVSTFGYDAFGRVHTVRLPTEQGLPGVNTRSLRFSYQISEDKSAPTVVRSRQLASVGSDGVGHYEDTWTVYDGLMRERQTQTLSPADGRVIATSTKYDDRGNVHDEMAPEAVAGTPGTGYLPPSDSQYWQNRTRHIYDALGRVTEEQEVLHLDGTTDVTTTSYAYTEDTVTVTGPTGTESRETVDGLGRTVEAAEWEDGDGEWATASYTYDAADRVLSATDPSGNVTSYSYNLAGWKTAQDDPNRGAASYQYDLLGNLRMAEDATGTQMWTTYDALSRSTARRSDSDTGTLLASWAYDTAPGGLGQPASSTRHTGDGDWTTAVEGYDSRGRATGSTLTVPAGVDGLSGTYSVTQEYDRADRPITTSYGPAGDLPAETVTTTYDALGMTDTLVGAEEYVRGADYDNRGRPSLEVYGPPDPTGPSDIWQAKTYTYNTDQQPAGVEVHNAAATDEPDAWVTVLDRDLSYDDAGQVVERASTVAGLGSARECFDYDSRMRVTAAWTVELSESETCDSGTPGSGDGGYERHYSYSPDSRIEYRTEAVDPTEADRIEYSYPSGDDPDQPHAPTAVGSDSYSWDANGNLVSRTVDGTSETFTWDAEQRLVSVDGPGGDDESFVYDAEGSRLLRTTPDGTALYFAGQEITADTDGTATTVRSYSFNGSLVATRTAAGVQYLVTDERGSVELAAPSLGVPSAARAYDPYGQDRANDGAFPTDRGYLGQIEDDATGLSYLNARYYDTRTGMFTAPDPVVDLFTVDRLNPYTYTAGNPIGLTDASGAISVSQFGIERQNQQLRRQNSKLVSHIGKLNGHISELQGIIRRQQNYITELVAQVRAMAAIIRQQATVINKLQARVVHLTRQVNYWHSRAVYWYNQAAYWHNQAVYWHGQAVYWHRQAVYWHNQAVYWRGQAVYWRGQAIHWHGVASQRARTIVSLTARVQRQSRSILGLTYYATFADIALGAARSQIEARDGQISSLERDLADTRSAFSSLYDEYLGATDPSHMGTWDAGCHYASGGGNLGPNNSIWGNITGVVWQAAQWTPGPALMSHACYVTSAGS